MKICKNSDFQIKNTDYKSLLFVTNKLGIFLGENNSLIYWNLKTKKCEKKTSFSFEKTPLEALLAKRCLVSCLENGTVQVIKSGRLKKIGQRVSLLYSLHLHQKIFFCFYQDGSAFFWKYKSPNAVNLFSEKNSNLRHLTDFKFEKNYLITVTKTNKAPDKNYVTIKDLACSFFKKEFETNETVTCLESHENHLYFGTSAGSIYAWNIELSIKPEKIKQESSGLVWLAYRNAQLIFCTLNGSFGRHSTSEHLPSILMQSELALLVRNEKQKIMEICLAGQSLIKKRLQFKKTLFPPSSESTSIEVADLATQQTLFKLKEFSYIPKKILFEKDSVLITTDSSIEIFKVML